MLFSQPISDLIIKRYSCRNYLDKPIQADICTRLTEFTSTIQFGPLGNKARFEFVTTSDYGPKILNRLGTYGFIKGATGFIIGALQPGSMDLEDYGYLMERIILFATDLGLGTCWLGGTFTKSSFSKRINARENESVPAVAAVGIPSQNPRWFQQVIRRRAKAERRLDWDLIFTNLENGSPLTKEAAGLYGLPLEMVRLGPSASNKQPWRIVFDGSSFHFFLKRTPGYRESQLVKVMTVADMQRLDMGIAMCHFELTARELGLTGSWQKFDGVIKNIEPSCEYIISWMNSG
jgi:hypothetical protein